MGRYRAQAKQGVTLTAWIMKAVPQRVIDSMLPSLALVLDY